MGDDIASVLSMGTLPLRYIPMRMKIILERSKKTVITYSLSILWMDKQIFIDFVGVGNSSRDSPQRNPASFWQFIFFSSRVSPQGIQCCFGNSSAFPHQFLHKESSVVLAILLFSFASLNNIHSPFLSLNQVNCWINDLDKEHLFYFLYIL